MDQMSEYLGDIKRGDTLKENVEASFRIEPAWDGRYNQYLMPYLDLGQLVLKENKPKWVSDWSSGMRILYPGTGGYLSLPIN